MTHARTQIRRAFVDTLESITAVTIHNGRVFPFHDGILPAITVFSREESISEDAGRKARQQQRNLLVSTQIYLKSDDSLDDDLDDFAELIEIAVFQSTSINPLVRCLDLISTEIEITQEGERQMGDCTLTFSCKYLTNDGAPGNII